MKPVGLLAVLVLIPGALLSAEPQLGLAIRIYDRSGLSRGEMHRGVHQLEVLYRSAGIKAMVRSCPLPDSCAEAFERDEVAVRLLSAVNPSHPRQLGVAFVAHRGNLSTVYAGAVVEA